MLLKITLDQSNVPTHPGLEKRKGEMAIYVDVQSATETEDMKTYLLYECPIEVHRFTGFPDQAVLC